MRSEQVEMLSYMKFAPRPPTDRVPRCGVGWHAVSSQRRPRTLTCQQTHPPLASTPNPRARPQRSR